MDLGFFSRNVLSTFAQAKSTHSCESINYQNSVTSIGLAFNSVSILVRSVPSLVCLTISVL